MTCTTLLHHSLPVRVCGVSSEAHDQYQIFDRSSLELLLDTLEWKFCCYLSLAEYDPAAFVLFFRFLLIRIVILNTFLIQPLPLHEMKISQSDLWVQTLHKWLLFTRCHPSMFYIVCYSCVPVIDKSNASCTVYICTQGHFPSSFPMYTGPQNQYTKMKVNKVEPEWLHDCQNTKQENFWEDSTKNYLLWAEARELQV